MADGTEPVASQRWWTKLVPVVLGVVVAVAALAFFGFRSDPTIESAPEPDTAAADIETPQTTSTTEAPQDESEEAVDPPTLISGDYADVEIIVVYEPGNSTMDDIRALTPDFFTPAGGANVTFMEQEGAASDVLADGTTGVRLFLSQPVVVMIGSFEAPQFGNNLWLMDLGEEIENDPLYDSADLIPSVRQSLGDDGERFGTLFALPFYAESSFLMYNREILEVAGIPGLPDEPTWEEIADVARVVDSEDTAGICLRGLPGWGDLGASLTTVVNAFGGTWWAANNDGTPGEPQINQPDSGFRAATEFYVELAKSAGQNDVARSSFPQCLELFESGQVAMWYDTTYAPSLFQDDSAIAGNLGIAQAPTGPTSSPSGWLWSWGLAIPRSTASSPDVGAAVEFIKWATSPEFVRIAGEHGSRGLVGALPGTRVSTFDLPGYREATEPFGTATLDSLVSADPINPGITPRPGLPGVQYVGIPEFQDVGTRCTVEVSAAIAGNITTDQALDRCQALAADVSR